MGEGSRNEQQGIEEVDNSRGREKGRRTKEKLFMTKMVKDGITGNNAHCPLLPFNHIPSPIISLQSLVILIDPSAVCGVER